MDQYRKILRVKYQNKIFDIFVDEEHKKHFLEVRIENNQEHYYYPNLKDYVALNNIYNISDNILYEKKYSFPKKILVTGTLGVILALSIKPIEKIYTLEKQSNVTQSIEFEQSNYNYNYEIKNDMIIIYHADALEIFGYNKVSFNEVEKTLEKNNAIPKKYKEYILEFIQTLKERLPKLDLTVFNENLKDLEIEVVENDAWSHENSDGFYVPLSNTITVKENYADEQVEKLVMFHELVHTINNAYLTCKDKETSTEYKIEVSYDTTNNYGRSFTEGMTTIVTDYLLSPNWENYFEMDSHLYTRYSPYANLEYQFLMLDENYTVYNFLNGNVKLLEPHLKNLGLEDMVDILDTSMNTSEKDIQDRTSLENLEKNIINQRIVKMIEEGQSDLEIYQHLCHLPLYFNPKYETYTEILNQNKNDWTFRIENPTVTEQEILVDINEIAQKQTITTKNKEIKIYDENKVILETSSVNNILIYSLKNDTEEKYYFGYIDYRNDTMFNILTSEVINKEDIKNSIQLESLVSNFGIVNININTSFLETEYLKKIVRENDHMKPEIREINSNNHSIK